MSESTVPKERLTLKQAGRRYAKAIAELKRLGVTGYHLGIGFTKGKGQTYQAIAIPANSLKYSNRGPFHLNSSEAYLVSNEGTVGTRIEAGRFALLVKQNLWIW